MCAEELIVAGQCVLTGSSVAALTSLPRLARLGDLMDWRLGEERGRVFRQLEAAWETRMGYSRDILAKQ